MAEARTAERNDFHGVTRTTSRTSLQGDRVCEGRDAMLPRQLPAEGFEDGLDEAGGGRGGGGFVIAGDWDDDANEGRVGAVEADRIEHQADLGSVLTGDYPVAALVPIHHD